MRGAFLSSSSRSAPPRDIMLEEPDVMNPGQTHTCITLNSVFVYYTMLEKFSCMYIFSVHNFIQYVVEHTFTVFMYNNML